MRPAVLSLMVVVFGLTTGEFVIAGILPDIAGDVGVSVPAAGRLITAYAVGMIVGGPVVTLATARIGRKPLALGLIAVAVAGNVGSALAPGYVPLVVSRFVAGSVVATFFAVAVATAVGMAPAGRQASTVAKVALGMNLGIVAGTPLGTVVGQHLGWRVTFGAVAAFTAAGLLLVARYVPARPAAATGTVRGELRVFAHRGLQLAVALTALGNLGVAGVFTYVAVLLTGLAGFPPAAVPVLLVGYGIGAVVGNSVGGWLADRSLMPSLVGLFAALAVVLAAFGLAGGNRTVAAALTVLLGALAFAVVPGTQARILSAARAAPTLGVAVNASGYQLAAAFAGVLGGWLVAGPGPRWLPLAGALTTLAAVALGYAMLRGDRRAVSTDAVPVDAP
ncbi:MFS transporter [Actinocatenispora rupis]|uniref:MFS transporter n=1 Tax=Actinocatenispora rupis TaxID=519421 RepID=A0A8J3J687_9ACTN|nr:MFS transporter [Actinocatenispora rupis]GID10962.1 MFS transporter [Actinocatenispora rupis]